MKCNKVRGNRDRGCQGLEMETTNVEEVAKEVTTEVAEVVGATKETEMEKEPVDV